MNEMAGEERFEFQAEVGRLLDIVARSLYSDKSVFLRELVSNAADACDKLRYLALTKPGLIADDPEFRIRILADKAARTLTVADNGIGMARAELIENLGTIARSGTAAFAADAPAPDDAPALIGQFGVGFYAAFMVAERVEVTTCRAGEEGGFRWSSVGKGEFTLVPEPAAMRGTSVILHLAEGEDEYLDPARLKAIVEKYSNHIGVPIELDDGGGAKATINAASALWLRPREGVAPEEYAEFYRHHGHAFDAPWITMHFRTEGMLAYAGLMFIPTARPFDLFNPERRQCVKLYVRRVFVTDDCEILLPPWLRFVRGIVDSEDLPLNISREMLQSNPVLAKIRSGLIKRVLGELTKKAKDAPEEYAQFWDAFGAVLKEGLYEEPAERDRILPLTRYRTTSSNALVTLDDYVARMKDGQAAIYYITGDNLEAASRSPQLEGFRARGVEVLLLTDGVDEFWLPAIGSYAQKPFRSVTKGSTDLDRIAAPEKPAAKASQPEAGALDALVAWLRLTLDHSVKDVRTTGRLTESPACLVAADGDLDMRLERILRAHKQLDAESKRVLEINPGHALIAALAGALKNSEKAALDDAAFLLLDQARLAQGEEPADPVAFAKRMTAVMVKALGG
ncbi:MAG: molecular chaperone HtpG [Dongiaceae bacterium]